MSLDPRALAFLYLKIMLSSAACRQRNALSVRLLILPSPAQISNTSTLFQKTNNNLQLSLDNHHHSPSVTDLGTNASPHPPEPQPLFALTPTHTHTYTLPLISDHPSFPHTSPWRNICLVIGSRVSFVPFPKDQRRRASLARSLTT